MSHDPWDPNWDPKNSGCLGRTQRVGGEVRVRLVNGEHPKVVQEMRGHTSITLTQDAYSQVLPRMQEEPAARLNDLLGGGAGEVSWPDEGNQSKRTASRMRSRV